MCRGYHGACGPSRVPGTGMAQLRDWQYYCQVACRPRVHCTSPLHVVSTATLEGILGVFDDRAHWVAHGRLRPKPLSTFLSQLPPAPCRHNTYWRGHEIFPPTARARVCVHARAFTLFLAALPYIAPPPPLPQSPTV